jgi:hypothetical protein
MVDTIVCAAGFVKPRLFVSRAPVTPLLSAPVTPAELLVTPAELLVTPAEAGVHRR